MIETLQKLKEIVNIFKNCPFRKNVKTHMDFLVQNLSKKITKKYHLPKRLMMFKERQKITRKIFKTTFSKNSLCLK